MTARLPTPGGDANTWGGVLNDYLQQSLATDGTLVTGATNSYTSLPNTNLASGSKPGLVQLAGDLGNTAVSPQVTSTHLSSSLPVNQGGTGAATLTGLVLGNGTSAMTTVTAPSGTVVGTSDTQTLTNKRITKRVTTASDATSITPNTDSADITYQSNSQATGTLTINADGGAPTNGQSWLLKIKSTNVQTFAWNALYVGGAIALPSTTTGGGKIDHYAFLYDTVNSKWQFTGGALGY